MGACVDMHVVIHMVTPLIGKQLHTWYMCRQIMMCRGQRDAANSRSHTYNTEDDKTGEWTRLKEGQGTQWLSRHEGWVPCSIRQTTDSKYIPLLVVYMCHACVRSVAQLL
jgi:hypothetical protein